MKNPLRIRQLDLSIAEKLIITAIVGILVSLAVGFYTHSEAHNRDVQRKEDIKIIQDKVARYYGINGIYPLSLGQLPDIPAEACQDPKGSGNCLQPDYTYKVFAAATHPSPEGQSNCNNKDKPCVSYVIYSNSMETLDNPYFVTSQ